LGYISRISGDPKFIPTKFLLFLLSAWRDAWSVEPSLSPSAESVDQMVPFWLCLDEMNLAPVEQYFADYLSVLEQRSWAHGRYSCPPLLPFEPGIDDVVRQALDMNDEDPLWASFKNIGGIPLPPNLVIVGTVNMDETTHGFSRKVLDRALTVELDSIDFSVYGGTSISGYTSEVPWTKLSSVTSALDVSIPEGNKTTVLELLERWNELLDGTPFRIAYRTINESLLIAASLPDRPLEEALDWIAMAKLLPRLEGDEDRLGMDRDGREESYLDEIVADWSVRFGNMWEGSRAKRKIEYMKSRLARSGYTSYWP
jgi:hypothetical protein